MSMRRRQTIALWVLLLALMAAGCSRVRGDVGNLTVMPDGAYNLDLFSLYAKQGETGEGRSLRTGIFHFYLKPSWSAIGDSIVFMKVSLLDSAFRNYRDWTPVICAINGDGTGYRELTEGRYGDFNPTWMRTRREIFFSRLNQSTNRWGIYLTTPDSAPGEEILVSDPRLDEIAVTASGDGRMFIESEGKDPPGKFFFLKIARDKQGHPSGKIGKYTKVNLEPFPETMRELRLVRPSISPDDTKISFEFTRDPWNMDESFIYIADLEIKGEKARIFNYHPLSLPGKTYSTIYARWDEKGDSIIYSGNPNGKYQFYRYDLKEGMTVRISAKDNSNYIYFTMRHVPN